MSEIAVVLVGTLITVLLGFIQWRLIERFVLSRAAIKELSAHYARIDDALTGTVSSRSELTELNAIIAALATQKAAEVIAQGEKHAAEIIKEAITRAISEVEQPNVSTKLALRRRIAAAALAGAEMILRKELERKIHDQLERKIPNL